MANFNKIVKINPTDRFVRIDDWNEPLEKLHVLFDQITLLRPAAPFPQALREELEKRGADLTSQIFWMPVSRITASGPSRESVTVGYEPPSVQSSWDGGNPDFLPSEEKLYDLARRCLAAGFSVIPIDRPGMGGEPSKYIPTHVQHWKQFRHRTVDKMERWDFWGSGSYGLGVVCGPMSGNLEVEDFDTPDYWQLWSSEVKEQRPALFARLVIHQTPDIGHHVLWRCPVIQGNQKLARERLGEEEVITHIETRGDGGLILLPGSPADCHPSNRPYLLIQGTPETVPLITEEERAFLLDTARQYNKFVGPGPRDKRDENEPFVEDPDAPWTDFSNKTTFQEILEPHGWKLCSGTWESGELTRPGKSQGVSATIGYMGLPILHVFTSNTRFDPEGNYSKSACFAILNHDGDFSVAANVLIDQGYGKQGREMAERRRVEGMLKEVFSNATGGSGDEPEHDDDTEEIVEEPALVVGKVSDHGTTISPGKPYETAKSVVANLWTCADAPTVYNHGKIWWQWDGRRYHQREDGSIRQDIYEWLSHAVQLSEGDEGRNGKKKLEKKPFHPTRSKVNDVVDGLRALTWMENIQSPRFLGEDQGRDQKRFIAMSNGLLDVNRYLRGDTDCILPHTPLWFSENALPYRFDSQAKCPTWEWFVNDVTSGNREAVAFLQDWFGYCLTPDQSLQVLLMLVGSGCNGKGVTNTVFTALLGDGNYCTPTFSSMAERFGRWEFMGKLAAIMPDAHMGRETDAIRCLEFIKAVTGGDPVNIEPKGKDMLSGVRLNTRFMISVNEMPRLPDASRAIGRRVRILPFHQDYTGREYRGLTRKLLSELPGIFLWSLEGLRRIQGGSRLDQPQCGKSLLDEFVSDSSPVATFVQDFCDIGADHTEPTAILRAVLNEWLVESGHNQLSDTSVTKKLRAINSRIEKGRVRVDGRLTYVYKGICLNDSGMQRLKMMTREYTRKST